MNKINQIEHTKQLFYCLIESVTFMYGTSCRTKYDIPLNKLLITR